jgi:hypothetical protein
VGSELRASQLIDRHSTTGAMPPALFALVILEIGSHFFVGDPSILGFLPSP